MRICKTMTSQARGLMFRKKQNLVMIFPKEKRISLHMWWVFFPIDVLVLDKHKKIIEMKKDFKPFTFWSSKKQGKYVVELALPHSHSLGDRVNW